MNNPVAAARHPVPPGRGGSSNPGGPSGGGGWNSTAGVYYSWQTSAQSGNLGPFLYPQITGSGVVGPILVTNDVWNPIAGWQQTIFAADPGRFEVIANMPAGNGAVVSYPSNGLTYSNPTNTSLPLYLKDVTSFYSSFSEAQPDGTLPGVASEAAYDMWWNHYANEIMIQHDMIDSSNLRGGFPVLLTVAFGGSHGVPVHNWNLGIFGSEIIWQLADGVVNGVGGIEEGSVDIRAMVNWLADRGYLAADFSLTTCTGVGYGWEMCSTNGQSYLYRCNGFSSTFTYAPMETSPGLELSGFTITGPGPQDTISSVTVSVTEYQSSAEAQPCTIELWDYSGTPAQVGGTMPGARSTSSSNVSTATFYSGITYPMLATLRVRVRGNAATGYIESVGGVSLSVNYDPAPAAWPGTQTGRRTVTIPVRAG